MTPINKPTKYGNPCASVEVIRPPDAIEGSRSPKIDDKRRFLGSVTRPSPKTSKIKSTFLENVDGRTSIFG
jgi:hypothetical protein